MLGVLYTEHDVITCDPKMVCVWGKDVSMNCQPVWGIVLFLDNWKYA